MNPAINQHSYEYTFWNQTPEIYQEYREPYRTTSVPFASGKEALWNLEQPIPQRDFRKDSQFVINLNGTAQSCTWQFHWAYSCRDKAIQTEPKADPRAFTGTQYKENIQWDYISVPMSWQVAQTFDQETGLYRRLYDAPMYIGDGVIFENYNKPRDAATLRVDPDTASVDTYRRTFQVPQPSTTGKRWWQKPAFQQKRGQFSQKSIFPPVGKRPNSGFPTNRSWCSKQPCL